MLQLTTKHNTKYVMVKTDPTVQANTIPLSRYWRMFPHEVTNASTPKQGALHPSSQSWIFHDDMPQPLIGQFVVDVQHISHPRSYPTLFYVFEDVMSPQILLSYTALEYLGILKFKVPNQVAQSHIDVATLSSPETPGDSRKTTKRSTFQEPLESQPPDPSPWDEEETQRK